MATILIAEDDKTSRTVLTSILSNLGYAVLPCINGQQAYDILLSHDDIDMLVTDYMMPEMDGLELTQKIREIDRFKKLPIIMITAYIGIQKTDETLQKGVSALMVKPLKKDELIEYLDYYLD